MYPEEEREREREGEGEREERRGRERKREGGGGGGGVGEGEGEGEGKGGEGEGEGEGERERVGWGNKIREDPSSQIGQDCRPSLGGSSWPEVWEVDVHVYVLVDGNAAGRQSTAV